MEAFSIICAILAAASALCAVIAFFANSAKEKTKSACDFTWLKSDMVHVKNGIDVLQADVKQLSQRLDEMRIQQGRTEERLSELEDRVTKIEKKL